MCLAKQLIIRDLLLTSKRPPVITCLGRSGHIFSESWLSKGMEGGGKSPRKPQLYESGWNHSCQDGSFLMPRGLSVSTVVVSPSSRSANQSSH